MSELPASQYDVGQRRNRKLTHYRPPALSPHAPQYDIFKNFEHDRHSTHCD